MTTTWVVVAHQAGARIMEHRSGFGRHLLPVQELDHPEGRLRNHEIETDRAGATLSSNHGATGGRAMLHEHTAHEHVVEGFVRKLMHEIEKARVDGKFDALILVADPKLLGALRAGLDGPTARTLVASVSKDLAAVPSAQVADHISSGLPL